MCVVKWASWEREWGGGVAEVTGVCGDLRFYSLVVNVEIKLIIEKLFISI